MPVIVSYDGSINACDAFTTRNTGLLRVGLFQNDWDPRPWQTISAVVPCDFSGYDGLHALMAWSAAVMEGDQAVSRAVERIWIHNGGPVQGYVFGYYVVDPTGKLLWAERDPAGPVPMINALGVYRCVPTWTQSSKFGNE